MKEYKIIKLIHAKNLKDAVKREVDSEIVAIELNEAFGDFDKTNKLGFNE